MQTPRTIDEYLQQLRAALCGADPALVQDALYDAEEHLRAELAEQPGRSEAEMLAQVAGSYGAPEEVAAIYREQEVKVQRALRPPPPPRRRSRLGRFVGVAADARTYGVLFYSVLALATGIFYFTWVVTGLALSAGLLALIVGIPFLVLFFGSVRGLALLEGRIVETMLGVRMPRRPPYASRDQPLLKRIGTMFADPRSWGSLLYMLLMLPLGIGYFTVFTSLLAVSLGLVAAPLAFAFQDALDLPGMFVGRHVLVDFGRGPFEPGWGTAFGLALLGAVLLFAMLHLMRAIGHAHGLLAKHLLVQGVGR